jgi:hypothetical protein
MQTMRLSRRVWLRRSKSPCWDRARAASRPSTPGSVKGEFREFAEATNGAHFSSRTLALLRQPPDDETKYAGQGRAGRVGWGPALGSETGIPRDNGCVPLTISAMRAGGHAKPSGDVPAALAPPGLFFEKLPTVRLALSGGMPEGPGRHEGKNRTTPSPVRFFAQNPKKKGGGVAKKGCRIESCQCRGVWNITTMKPTQRLANTYTTLCSRYSVCRCGGGDGAGCGESRALGSSQIHLGEGGGDSRRGGRLRGSISGASSGQRTCTKRARFIAQRRSRALSRLWSASRGGTGRRRSKTSSSKPGKGKG